MLGKLAEITTSADQLPAERDYTLLLGQYNEPPLLVDTPENFLR